MPSTSPGQASSSTPSDFAQILPGEPAASLQALTAFVFRHKQYIAYISGYQLNLLSSPTKLVQAITFKEELVAVASDSLTGKLAVAGNNDVYILEPVTEGWTKIWWEKALSLRREDAGDEARCLGWGNEGELLVGGSHQLTLFSTLPSSRTSSPAASPVEGEAAEERRPLWSKHVASPVQQAGFSPSASLIATCGVYDRLVKIWRRLSFEEGLFDYTYLPHPGTVTHIEWRPMHENSEERRGSGISGRQDEDPEMLFTLANDGKLRVWRTGSMHDMEILVLHTVVDLVSAIPDSPSLTVNGTSKAAKPPRYASILPADKFGAAVAAALSKPSKGGVSHSLEHLKEIASKSPDVVVTVDGHGRMSAWGLQSIGHKRRPETPGSNAPFHITHMEGLPLQITNEANARLYAWFENDKFQILAHDFTGEVGWWQSDVEKFFSTAAAGSERLRQLAVLSGHSRNVKRLDQSKDGTSLISRDAAGKVMTWIRDENGLVRPDRSSDQTRADGEEQNELPNGTVSALSVHSGEYTITVNDSGVLSKVGPALSVTDEKARETHESFETGLRNPAILAANTHIAALSSSEGGELVIIDLEDGYVEHRQQTPGVSIRHLSCFASSPGHNLVAVGYTDQVEILVQGHYRHHIEATTWVSVKRVSITGLGLSIDGVTWLRDGSLALAAANGIFLSSNHVSAEHLDEEVKQSMDLDTEPQNKTALSQISARLKRPLPVWHPRIISHLVRHGEVHKASGLLARLAEKLKFWSEGEDLHALLDPPEEQILHPFTDTSNISFSDDIVQDLQEQLDGKDLPAVSDSEQRLLKKVVEAIAYLSEHRNGLDHCALRYLFSWKLQSLLLADDPQKPQTPQPNGVTHIVQSPVPEMHWREIAFASHSTTQQPLLDILVLYYDNKITWPIARSLGITAWLADKEALAQIFESLAQTAYRSSSPPDPTNASLYFLALHKKPTLLALWRIATWHKEQRATTNFLKRDFTQTDAKTAAKKNAYALMGKRRFEYAAAFFLLAGDAASATSLLAGQCEDIMLAIAVARLYDGDGSPTLQKLLGDRLIPKAHKDGDRWLMSWCHSILLQKHEAAHALIKPVKGVRYWHQDDPTTLILYRHLRKHTSDHEYEAVLRGARVLRRMGLWLLALGLVANWEFKPQQPSPPAAPNSAVTNGVSHEPPSMLDEHDPPPAANEPPSMLDSFAAEAPPVQDEKAAREAKAAELLKKLKAKKEAPTPVIDEKKPEPTQFKEPDANSLLDSFGF